MPATVTATPTGTSSPSPTPFAQVFNFGTVGGQPCGTTGVTFDISASLDFTVSALRIDFCVDPTVFQIAGVTCVTSSFSNSVALDAVVLSPTCNLDDPLSPSGQVRVDAHGTGGDSGTIFEPGDEISCTIPVSAAANGDYAVRYRVAATTSLGSLVNTGDGMISVFGTDRSQGECCTSDSQCGSGLFCRGGDGTQQNACCENECPTGVCNAPNFAGSCCAAGGLPNACNAP
jgi:hypothetical protein